MKWRKFDKKVNDELSGHQSEVDIDALWGALEPEVDAINAEKKKRRRAGLWWFFGGFLLIGVGAMILFFNQNEAVSIANFDNENKAIKQTTAATFNENKAVESVAKTVDDITKKEVAEANLNIKNTPSVISQNNISNSKNVIPKNQYSFNAEKLDASNNFEKSNNLNKNQNSIQNKNAAAIGNDLNKKMDVLAQKNTPIFNEKESKEETDNQISKNNSAVFDNQRLSPKDKNQLFQLPIDLLKNLDYAATELTRETLTNEEKSALEKEVEERMAKEEKRAQKKFNASANFYGGMSLANRNLTANGDSLTNELTQLRKKTEQNLETIQLGLQFNWQHKKTGLELTSGINYTQINEKFEYKVNEVTVDSIVGIEAFYRNVNGDTIAIMGMIPETTTANIHKRHFNKYRMIDIPILLGYRKRLGDFSIGAQAGVFVNLKLQTSGRFFNNETQTIDIDKADIFKTKVGLSYYLGATVDYHLTENWSVSAAPFVRHLPSNFAKASYGLEQKYTLYGLNVGLRYSF
ncbi:MAG: opacity protein-like surface antigen [Paraglaciecola sp.]|jgi:opacity protein-like surface antigen